MSVIVNPVFSKSDKELNSILKNQTEKLIKKCRKLLHKKLKLQIYLKGRKIAEHAPKSPPNLIT